MKTPRISLDKLIAARREAVGGDDVTSILLGSLLGAVRERRLLRFEAMVLVALTLAGNVAAALRWAVGVDASAQRQVLVAWAAVVMLSVVSLMRVGRIARRLRSLAEIVGQIAEILRRSSVARDG
jgi:hypothetical protein